MARPARLSPAPHPFDGPAALAQGRHGAIRRGLMPRHQPQANAHSRRLAPSKPKPWLDSQGRPVF